MLKFLLLLLLLLGYMERINLRSPSKSTLLNGVVINLVVIGGLAVLCRPRPNVYFNGYDNAQCFVIYRP